MKLIKIPKVLREKLGEDGADALIELINQANEKVKEDVIEISAEKFERRLVEEISKLRAEDITKLDKRITEEVSKLRIDMSKMYANLIKWMFIFWVGQIGVITAILFAFFKFMK